MRQKINGKAIRVSFRTYNELAKRGNLTQTFESVISNLLEQNEKRAVSDVKKEEDK